MYIMDSRELLLLGNGSGYCEALYDEDQDCDVYLLDMVIALVSTEQAHVHMRCKMPGEKLSRRW